MPDVPDTEDLEGLRRTLDAMCGPEIGILSCRQVPEDFSARLSARSRTYVYAIDVRERRDPFLARTSWRAFTDPGALDLGAMNEAAGHLVGQHDFTSFGRLRAPDATGVRNLYELRCRSSEGILRIKARADSFIQQMVRSLVGTLVEVGTGKKQPDQVPSMLLARDRATAGMVAPPQGLCLVAVEYDDGWSGPFDRPL